MKKGRKQKYKHLTWLYEEDKIHPFYEQWRGMKRRCSETHKPRNYSYEECTVCDEWLDYDTYYEWAEQNYYEIPGEKVCLDKDILVKGNKVYSPNTCIFVPQRINQLFESSKRSRGKYPVGITPATTSNKYMCRMRRDGKTIYLGSYETIEEAFTTYKAAKESYIKQIADEYIDLIPQELYNAMYNYEVEYDD